MARTPLSGKRLRGMPRFLYPGFAITPARHGREYVNDLHRDKQQPQGDFPVMSL